MAELFYEITDRPFRVPPAIEGEALLVDEGPDDLWPRDEYARVSAESVEASISPELQVSQQWGLRLPNGEVQWNTWLGNTFDNPLDRMKMVATLQKLAADLGLADGEQTDQFLAKYQWATRNQQATVVYVDTGAYPLMDPYVSALGAPESSETSHAHQTSVDAASSHGNGSHLGFRPGPVGGDAQ